MAGTSKIPIRGVAKMLTNLEPGIRAKLEAAFIEAEEQLDFHNTSTIDKVIKRIRNGTVGGPIVTVTTNTLGFDLSWPKLRDRVITMYEVQIATASNFSNAISYNTVENFFSVEGAAVISYARVRGVRWNGETGPWSNRETISRSVPVSAGPVVYSRTISNMSSFYINYPGTIYPGALSEISITPERQNGGIVFFGSVGVEFYVDATGYRGHRGNHYYIGANSAVDDSMRITINGRRIESLDYIPCFRRPGWSNLQAPPQATVFGYSVGFGPGYLKHSEFYIEEFPDVAPSVASHRDDQVKSSGAATHTGWLTKRNIQNTYDSAVDAVNDATTYATVTPGPVAGGTFETTRSLVGDNFKFAIPSDSVVVGIKTKIFASTASTAIPTITRLRLINSDGVPRATEKGTGDTFTTATYGGISDLWGEAAGFWTPTIINSTRFGADLQGKVTYGAGAADRATDFAVQGIHITVYTNRVNAPRADIRIQYKPRTNDFYTYPYTRAILKNCTLNVVEFGTEVK
jgi:hypothetical protein